MSQVIELPEKITIGSIVGSCPQCGEEVLIVDYGDETNLEAGQWVGSCCGCCEASFWQWEDGAWCCYLAESEQSCEVIPLSRKAAV